MRYDARNLYGNETGHYSRMYSLSHDGGDTWGPLYYDDNLAANPNCQGALTTTERSAFILATAPSVRPERANMTLHCSEDSGDSWPFMRVLYAGPSGYSSVAALSDDSSVGVHDDVLVDQLGFTSTSNKRIAVLFERDDPDICAHGTHSSSCKITVALVDDFLPSISM